MKAETITERNRLLVILVALAGVGTDLASKAWVFADPRFSHREFPVLGSWMVVQLSYNPGAVWGILGGFTGALTVLSALAVPLLVWLAWREARPSVGFAIAIGLVLGGALGNLYDRVALGQVRDFIGVWLGSYRWPTFNLADSWITIGVAFLLLREWGGTPEASPATTGSGATGSGATGSGATGSGATGSGATGSTKKSSATKSRATQS